MGPASYLSIFCSMHFGAGSNYSEPPLRHPKIGRFCSLLSPMTRKAARPSPRTLSRLPGGLMAPSVRLWFGLSNLASSKFNSALDVQSFTRPRLSLRTSSTKRRQVLTSQYLTLMVSRLTLIEAKQLRPNRVSAASIKSRPYGDRKNRESFNPLGSTENAI